MEHRVANEVEVALGSCQAVIAGDVEIVLFRHRDGSFSALEDRCSHADVQLSQGNFEDGIIECMAHGAKFDAHTGRHLCMPAVTPVKRFEVRVRDGEVFVNVD